MYLIRLFLTTIVHRIHKIQTHCHTFKRIKTYFPSSMMHKPQRIRPCAPLFSRMTTSSIIQAYHYQHSMISILLPAQTLEHFINASSMNVATDLSTLHFGSHYKTRKIIIDQTEKPFSGHLFRIRFSRVNTLNKDIVRHLKTSSYTLFFCPRTKLQAGERNNGIV